MTLTNINSASLRKLIKLTERKEFLLLEITRIDAQISSLIQGKPAPREKQVARTSKSAAEKTGKRAKRGALKTKIFAALRAAGEAGLKVPELSKKIGVKSQNIHVWLSSTGKNLSEIKRIGKGHFKFAEK